MQFRAPRVINLHRYSAWLLFVVVAGGYWFLSQFYPVAYVWMTYEDLYGEWMQMWLFVAVFVLAAMNARQPGPYRIFFVLLAVAGLYTFLEEISYGQRLFGVRSPEFFEEYNIQGETNLHNFLTGPVSTILKDVIEYTLALALVAYGFIYPAILRRRVRIAAWLKRIGVAPAPLYLAPFFLLAAYLELGWLDFNEAEVAEILVGTALVGMLLHYLYAHSESEADVAILPPPPASAVSARQGATYLALFAALAGLAWGTTSWVNSKPDIFKRTEGRVTNGYQKYARRMELKGRYADAAEFYLRAHLGMSGGEDLLRSAVINYKSAGDEENYRRYYRVLLDAEANEKALTSTGVEQQLSFAQAYAEIGDAGKEKEFLARGLFYASERVKRFPKNPENHYWLGRALQQQGDYPKALAAYREAVRLKPDEERYATAIAVLERSLQRQSKSPGKNWVAPD